MVNTILLPNEIHYPRLVRAFKEVPRELFVDSANMGLAYADVMLSVASNRFLLKPLTLARILQALNILLTDKVLLIGSAYGYSLALLSYCCATVYGIEVNSKLYKASVKNLQTVEAYNVRVLNQSFIDGYLEPAPYDIILIEGGAECNYNLLKNQLKVGGRLVFLAPDPHTLDYKIIVLYKISDTQFSKSCLFRGDGFMLPGFENISPKFKL